MVSILFYRLKVVPPIIKVEKKFVEKGYKFHQKTDFLWTFFWLLKGMSLLFLEDKQ